METPITKRHVKSRIPFSPLSPSLRPGKAQTPKSVKKEQEKSVVSIQKAIKNVSLVEDKASELGLKFIDFGENKIKADTIKSINQQCSCLNLNKIDLVASQIPLLKELRSLSLENCKISTLKGFPKLENLRYLSLKDNKLQNLQGAVILKNLECLKLENNLSNFPADISIAAFGAISLKEYNGEQLTDEIYSKAFSYSPIVGYALRNGLQTDFIPDSNEEEEQQEETNKIDIEKISIDYLTKDLVDFMTECQVECRNKLTIKKKGDEFCIVCPYKSDSIKWYIHDNIDFETNEWTLIKGESSDSLPITLNLRMHLVRCEISFENRQFYLYTQQPVGRDVKELCIPFPITPTLTGISRDGFILSIKDIGIPAKYLWIDGNDTIAEDTSFITLSTSLVGKQITCQINPTISNSKLQFCSYFALSNTIQPVQPTVSGIEFPESIIEFEPFTVSPIFYPGEEGESEIYLEKAKSQHEEFVRECEISKDDFEIVPESHLVGYYLRISYTPVTISGTKGETKYFYSSTKVLPSIPQFVDPFIAGSLKTHYSLAACATYIGGLRGKCIYKWYVSDAPITASRKGVRGLPIACEEQIFVPKDEHIDMYVAVEMIPVRFDECVGDPVFASTTKNIQMEKQPQTIEHKGKVFLNNKFVFEEEYDFYISDSSQEDGFALVKQGQKFSPKEEYLGRMLRIGNQTTDTIVGEIVQPLPEISEMTLDPFDGGIARLNVKAKGINWERIEVAWFRLKNDVTKAVAIDTPDYVLTPDDIDGVIFAVVVLFDENHDMIKKYKTENSPKVMRSHLLLPTIVGTMIEGTNVSIECDIAWEKVTWFRSNALTSLEAVSTEKEYTLTSEDVGSLIKAQVTLIQKNKGANGKSERFTVMATADEYVRLYFPSVKVTAPQEIFEGERIVPIVTSGEPDKYNQFQYEWFRKSERGALTSISESPDYIPTKEDIGCYLMFSVAVIGSDKRTPGPYTTLDVGPVAAHTPVAEKVKITQGENGYLFVSYNYYGGDEGKTEIEWVVVNDKSLRSIGKTKQKTIKPLENMFDKNISAVVTPVRNDGTKGNPVLAEKPVNVKPLPVIESATLLVKKGKLVSGSIFRVKAKASHHVGLRYQWFRSGYGNWDLVEGATNVEYEPNEEDVDRLVKCEVIAYNKDGWTTDPYIVETQRTVGDGSGLLLLGNDGADISTIGTLLHTNLSPEEAEKTITFEIYRGNKLIDEVQDSQLLITANYAGAKIRARSTNGLMTQMTDEISISRKLTSFVNSISRTNTFKFTATSTIGNSFWTCTVGQSGLVMVSKNGVKKTAKWKLLQVNCVYQTIDEMELWVDQSTKFILRPEPSLDARAQAAVTPEMRRDFTVYLINLFKSKFES